MEDDVAAPTADSVRPGASERPERRALAATQLAILQAEAWASDPSAYTLVSTVEAAGIPDWPLLIDSVHRTLRRHDVFSWRLSLDTSYQLATAGGPGTGTTYEIEQVDLRDSSRPDADAAIQDRLNLERGRAIPLLQRSSEPTTRVLLFRLPAGQDAGHAAVCSLITHHVLVDEYATELLWNEVFRRAAQHTTAEQYDRRFAEWAAESVAAAAVPTARQAAHEILRHLGQARLDPLPRTARPLQARNPSRRCASPCRAPSPPPLPPGPRQWASLPPPCTLPPCCAYWPSTPAARTWSYAYR